jgi:hypothetical protein
MVPEKQRKNNHFDGIANEAYARAGFVFFIASGVIGVMSGFIFSGPDRPPIIGDISYSAVLASTYCFLFAVCGVPAGRVFSRLPLLGILAIMLLPLGAFAPGIFTFMMLLTVFATIFLPSLYKWWRK